MHSASSIISGKFDIDRIPDLDGSKITTGIGVKEPSVDLDAYRDNSNNYFGITDDVTTSITKILDKDSDLISEQAALLEPAGYVHSYVDVHNPQLGSTPEVRSRLDQVAGKSSDAYLRWQVASNGTGSSLHDVVELSHEASSTTDYIDSIKFHGLTVSYSTSDGYSYNIPGVVPITPAHLGIIYGRTEKLDLDPNKYIQSYSITFPDDAFPSGESGKLAFSNAPHIFLTLRDNIQLPNEHIETIAENYGGITLIDRSTATTTTGFQIDILNGSHSDQQLYINWLAIGPVKFS